MASYIGTCSIRRAGPPLVPPFGTQGPIWPRLMDYKMFSKTVPCQHAKLSDMTFL